MISSKQVGDDALRCIFAFLPITGVLKNASLTCKSWNASIDDVYWELVTRRDCDPNLIIDLVGAAAQAGTDAQMFLAKNTWLHSRVLYTMVNTPPGSQSPSEVSGLLSWKDVYSYLMLLSHYPSLCAQHEAVSPGKPLMWLNLRANSSYFSSIRQDTLNLLSRRTEALDPRGWPRPTPVFAWSAALDVLRNAYDSTEYADVVCKHSSIVSLIAAALPTYATTVTLVNWASLLFSHAKSGFDRAVRQIEFPANWIAKMFASFISLEAKMKSWIVSFHRDWYPAPEEIHRVVGKLATSSDKNMLRTPYAAPPELTPQVLSMSTPVILAANAPLIACIAIMEQQRLSREPFWHLVSKKASLRFALLLFAEKVFFSCMSSIATLVAAPMAAKSVSALIVATKNRALDWFAYAAIGMKLAQLALFRSSRTRLSSNNKSTAKLVTVYVLTRLILSIPVIGLASRVVVAGFARGACFVDGNTAQKILQPGYFNELYRGDRTSLVAMVCGSAFIAALRAGAHFFASANLAASGSALCYTPQLEADIMNKTFSSQAEREAWAEAVVSGASSSSSSPAPASTRIPPRARTRTSSSVDSKWRIACRSGLVAGVELITSFIAVTVAIERQNLFVAARAKLTLDVLSWVVGYVAGKLC